MFPFLAVIACDDGDDDIGATPTVGPTAALTTGPTEDPATPGGATPWIYNDPIDFPDDLALTLEMGCYQCDGPTTSLLRLRRVGESLEELTVFPPATGEDAIGGVAFDASGNAAVSVCGPQYCGGLEFPPADAQTVVHVARDGGVLFVPGDALPGGRFVTGMIGGSPVLVGPYAEGQEDDPLAIYPDGNVIAYPPNGLQPIFLPDGVLWIDDNRSTIVDEFGTIFYTAPDGWGLGGVSSLNAMGSKVAITNFKQDDTRGRYLVVVADRTADALSPVAQFVGTYVQTGAPLDECRTVGNAQLDQSTKPTPEPGTPFSAGFFPAIIDHCEGVITPIDDPFTREPYLNGRNRVTQVQQGPFLSVTREVGDCLNVRLEPDPASTVVDCFVAGVLLRDLDESRPGDGQSVQTWRRIVTPAGDEGWASDEFLAP